MHTMIITWFGILSVQMTISDFKFKNFSVDMGPKHTSPEKLTTVIHSGPALFSLDPKNLFLQNPI